MGSVLDKKNSKLIGILFAAAGLLRLVLFFLTDREFEIDRMLLNMVSASALILICVAFIFKDKMFIIIAYLLEVVFFLWSLMFSIRYDFYFFSQIPYLMRFWGTEEIVNVFGSIIGYVMAAAAFAFLLARFINKSDFTAASKIAAGIMIAAHLLTDNLLYSVPFVFVYFIPNHIEKNTAKADRAVFTLSLEDELKNLKTKYELRQISEEEYNRKKAEILSKL